MKRDSETIYLILCGFGDWAKNRTVLPLLQSDLFNIKIISICSVPEHDFIELRSSLDKHIIPDVYFGTLENALHFSKRISGKIATIINTPNSLHYPTALKALNNGSHVYVERPVVTPNYNIFDLLEVARKKNCILYTGVQRRLESPYQYIFDIVQNQIDFGEITSIRCTLHSGIALSGWRKNFELCGGGILIDSGYHLLDIAAWIARTHTSDPFQSIYGSVYLGDFVDNNNLIEQTSFGIILLDGSIRLHFDFSYVTPQGSIYERIDVRDQLGTQISLTRNLAKRDTRPGLLRHQRHDGAIVVSRGIGPADVPLDNVNLDGTAMNTGPLAAFLKQVMCDSTDSEHPCNVEHSVRTWALVGRLYELGRNYPLMEDDNE